MGRQYILRSYNYPQKMICRYPIKSQCTLAICENWCSHQTWILRKLVVLTIGMFCLICVVLWGPSCASYIYGGMVILIVSSMEWYHFSQGSPHICITVYVPQSTGTPDRSWKNIWLYVQRRLHRPLSQAIKTYIWAVEICAGLDFWSTGFITL